MSFDGLYKEYISVIEAALPGLLPPGDTPQGSVAKAMDYAVTGGGKRIRGVLLLAIYRMVSGEEPDKAVPFAAALEMIHAYSLIHDDLPCMDNDDMRRGKPSCHIAFGESTALLAGDGLLTLAFQTCTAPGRAEAFGAGKALGAAHALAEAAGTGGMIGGQVIDLASEGEEIPLERLRQMDTMKTGALIAAAADMACILAGAPEETASLLRQFALELGMAFQIRDDILDQIGDAALLGKPIGSDAGNKKSTYTSHYGLEGAKEAAAGHSARARECLYATGLDASFLLDMTDFLLEREY